MNGFFDGILAFLYYLTPLALVLLFVRKFTKIPDELFRKSLHFVLLGAYIPLLFGFSKWWQATVFVVGLAVLLFPILFVLGRIKGFSAFVNERRGGEFKSSMILALGVMALSIALGWGAMHDRYLVLASVYAWGVGDAFAALIGKRYGKHKIHWRFVDNRKSLEGSLAMLLTSALSVFAVLLVRGGIFPIWCALIAIGAASASTFVELCTKNGMDTITCPLVSMLIIFPLTTLLGG